MSKPTLLVASDGVTPLRKPTAKQISQRVHIKGAGRTLWHSSIGSITPARLGQILRSHASGDLDDFLTFAEELEEKDQHYASVLGTRKRAVEGLEFEITAASKDRADIEIAEHCRALISGDAFVGLVGDLLDALGKGYSVLHQVWTTESLNSAAPWQPIEWEWLDPRLFQLDQDDGRTLRLKDPDDPRGLELEPLKYVRHFSGLKSGAPHRAALARLIAWIYMFGSFTMKDWVGYIETYGQPTRVGKYGPSASDEDIATLVRALRGLGTDAAAAVPESMQIDFIESATKGGSDAFQSLAEFCERRISKAVLGQTMTTDSGAGGIGNSQSDVHNEVRHDITRSDARNICASVMRDILKPYIDVNFGRQARYPLLTSPVLDPADIKVLSSVVKELVGLGLSVPTQWAHQRFGIPTARDGEDVLAMPSPTPAASDPALARAARGVRALAKSNGSPDAEALVAELIGTGLDDWEAINDQLVEPYAAVIDQAEGYDDAIRALAARYPNVSQAQLATSLRAAMAQARGIGDATD